MLINIMQQSMSGSLSNQLMESNQVFNMLTSTSFKCSLSRRDKHSWYVVILEKLNMSQSEDKQHLSCVVVRMYILRLWHAETTIDIRSLPATIEAHLQ